MALVPLGFVGMEYMPQTDESSFTVNIQAPVGSSPEETNRVAERIEGKLAELQAMRATLAKLIHRCHGDDRPDCPILDDLAGDDGATGHHG